MYSIRLNFKDKFWKYKIYIRTVKFVNSLFPMHESSKDILLDLSFALLFSRKNTKNDSRQFEVSYPETDLCELYCELEPLWFHVECRIIGGP